MTEMRYVAMAEEMLYIDLPGTDLRIKGILRGDLNRPLIVQVHGLPGTGNELLPNLAAHYYANEGFSSLRLFMYDAEDRTRDMVDCTVQTNADDLDVVAAYLKRKNVPQVFAVGHSYGGLAILGSSAEFDGAVLWDPTHGLVYGDPEIAKYESHARKRQLTDMTVYLDGMGYIEPKSIAEAKKVLGDTTQWAAHKGYPLKVIAAGKGIMAALGRRYVEAADEPKAFVEIDEAHHPFEDSDEVMLRLFAETTGWFKEILDAGHR